MKQRLNLRARKDLGQRIRAELDKQDKPLKWLAAKAGCSEKTIRNVLGGERTSGKSVTKICCAIGFDPKTLQSADISDDSHGGYTRASMSDYIGHFYAYRWDFSDATHIVRSAFAIDWDPTTQCLRFQQSQCYECKAEEVDAQKDYSQSGQIFVSGAYGHLHFVTAFRGAIRLITCFKYRLNNPSDLILRGLILTQGRLGTGYRPSAAPIILEKTDDPNFCQEKTKVLVLKPGDEEYEKIHRELLDTQRDAVKIAMAPEPQALLSGLASAESSKAA